MLIEARNGPDRIEIFPEVDDEDDLGNPRRVPSEIPVVLHVALHGLAASEFNLLGTAEMSAMGQQTNSMLTFADPSMYLNFSASIGERRRISVPSCPALPVRPLL